MSVVIGLGKVGCALADKFEAFDIVKIDVGAKASFKPDSIVLKKQKSPELYETEFPEKSVKEAFKGLKDSVIFLVFCGASHVSGCALRVLEILKENNNVLNILYISPRKDQLSVVDRLNDRVVSNVLQHYTRSGLLDTMYFIDNEMVETFIGQVPIVGFYDKLNNVIAQTFQVVQALIENGPVMGTNPIQAEVCRLATIGFVSENNTIALFHELPNIRQFHYLYAIKEERLKEESTILKDIRTQILQNKISTSYGIYSTNYENDYVYCLAFTSVVKEKK